MTYRWVPLDVDGDPHQADYHGNPADLIDACAELFGLLERPSWQQDAACRGQGPDAWFPTRGAGRHTGKAVCAGCPVRADCYSFAESQPAPLQGVWGGFTQRERAAARMSTAS